VIFAIAVIDEFFAHLKNPDRVNDSAEALRHE
jgi:hypothetical protein